MLNLLETRCSVWFALCCVAHICMTDITILISFLLIFFHYWAAFVENQQNRVSNTTSNSLTNIFSVNHIHDGSLRGCTRIGVQKWSLPKICRKYPTMMKLSTIIPYLTNINHVTHPLSFADISIFSPKIGNFCYIKKCKYRLHFNT